MKRLLPLVLLALFCRENVKQRLRKNSSYEDMSSIPTLRLDIRYATVDNFMRANVYGDFKVCFLHKKAAQQLRLAAAYLRKSHPTYKFLVFDCLRPRSVQRQLFEFVKGTEQEKYVADPDRGSIHNYGMAIDLSLADEKGKELDMGTGYDSFEPLAEPQLEEKHVREGKLTKAQLANRLILRNAMTKAGFLQLPHEWWHYDALPKQDVKARFQIIE